MKKSLILVFCLALAVAEPVEEDFEKCGDDFKCAEDKLISLVDEYNTKQSLPLVGDMITVERTHNENTKSNDGLYNRVARYISCHELKFNFPTNSRAGRILMEGM